CFHVNQELARTGGDGVGGAVEEAVADALGAFAGARGFDYQIGFFAEFAQAKIDVLFNPGATDAEAELVARFLLGGPARRAAWRIGVVPAENFIAGFQAGVFGVAARLDTGDGPQGVWFTLDGETESGANGFFFLEGEAGLRKEIGVGERFGAADVF